MPTEKEVVDRMYNDFLTEVGGQCNPYLEDFARIMIQVLASELERRK